MRFVALVVVDVLYVDLVVFDLVANVKVTAIGVRRCLKIFEKKRKYPKHFWPVKRLLSERAVKGMTDEELGACYDELRRAARMLARDASEADEILQEAVMSALRSPTVDTLTHDERIRWMKRAMKSRLIDIRRRERMSRERDIRPGEETRADDLTYVEVMQALGELSDDQRQIVAMSVLGGMNSAQIAATLNIPAPTVRTRLRAAMQNLRRMKQQGKI